MPALISGSRAPEFSLNLMGQPSKFSLEKARSQGPVLAAFFKVTCPTCQLAFPYLERMFAAYGNGKAQMIGISQDGPADTTAFAQQYGVEFPIGLDEIGKYPVSNAYGLTNVPTVFWISPEGKVEFSSVGWDKKDMERLNQQYAAAAGKPKIELFKPGDTAPDFKPG
ncbi:MAG TPA: TlpA disulfide reductase family protein [Terriglobales bacterium]|jgi:peroxiredoxin|nr:TlpA disulfide reductase family protein [Terriglobales bacterium]